MKPPIRLLGTVEVSTQACDCDLGPSRQRAVLATLLMSSAPLTGPEITARVWGEDPTPGASQSLRTYVCRLRQAVQAADVLSINRVAGGYRAVWDPDHLDLHRFRHLVVEARADRMRGDLPGALTGFVTALDLWPGEPLSGVGSPWLDDQRRVLVRERHAVRLEHNELALACGGHATLLPSLTAQVAEEPFDERLTGQLMLALQAAGRSGEALALYDRMRGRLRDELGTEPDAELRGVHRRVLRAEPSRSQGSNRRPVPHQLPPTLIGFVDRRAERGVLDSVLTSPADPSSPRTVVLTGTGGAGKTSLAVRWAREHLAEFPDGQLFLDLRGFDSSRPPTAPAAALHTLLLALGADPAALPADLDDLVGMYRSLLEGRRVLVVADNARCSDQVRPLLPADPRSAAVVTSRSSLAGLRTEQGMTAIYVGMFGTDDARTLLGNRLGAARVERESSSVTGLLDHCAGLPLALAIVAGRAALYPGVSLASLADELSDESTRLDGLRSGETGSDLRATVAASVSALPPRAVRAFGLLGLVPGPSVSISGFAAVSDLDRGEAVTVLRDLTALNLVEQEHDGRFRMHDLIRLWAADLGRTDPGARAAVGRLLGYYVRHASAPSSGPPSSGPPSSGADRAAVQQFVAVEAPSMLAAVDVAVAQGHDRLGCDLVAALADHLGSRGCWPDLVRLNATAAALARRLDDPGREVRALVDLGRGRIGRRDFSRAAADLARALVLAQTLDADGPRARVHRALARLAAHQNRHADALDHDQQALRIHLATGDLAGQGTAYNAIGWHQAHLGEPQLALASCRRALAIFEQAADRGGQALTLDSIGYALQLLGRSAEAQEQYRRSATLSADLGRHVARADTLHRLADSLVTCGRTADAQRARQEAAEVLRMTGVPVHDEQLPARAVATRPDEAPELRSAWFPRRR